MRSAGTLGKETKRIAHKAILTIPKIRDLISGEEAGDAYAVSVEEFMRAKNMHSKGPH